MNEKIRKEFLGKIFAIADKINQSNKSMEIVMLIDDANRKYDNHFTKLLRESGVKQKEEDQPFKVAFPSKELIRETFLFQQITKLQLKLYDMVSISKSPEAKEAYHYVITELTSIITD